MWLLFISGILARHPATHCGFILKPLQDPFDEYALLHVICFPRHEYRNGIRITFRSDLQVPRDVPSVPGPSGLRRGPPVAGPADPRRDTGQVQTEAGRGSGPRSDPVRRPDVSKLREETLF